MVPCILTHQYSKDDMALLVWAYKRGRELARRMPSYRGEYAPWHPQFPEGSAAVCHLVDTPAALDAPAIVYTAEDDKAIEQNIKQYCK